MTPPVPSADLLRGVSPLNAVSGADAARLRRTAEEFEATFIAQMLRPMFEGLNTEAPFGGGHAEETWRGFLIDAMAQQTVRAGGIGLTDQVMAEMIRMQADRSNPGAAQ